MILRGLLTQSNENSYKNIQNTLSKKDRAYESFRNKEKIAVRKLENENFVSINFTCGFITNTSWYIRILDKISNVTIIEQEERQVENFINSFPIQEGSTLKIYFKDKLDDLSYFLSNGSDSIGTQEGLSFISKIVSIDFSNFDASEVTTAANMFNQYTSLKTINFGNIVTSSLQNMNSMFLLCKSLENVNLSSFDTSLVTDMATMFLECKKLTSVNFQNIDTSNVKSMERMFVGCTDLEEIDIRNFNTSSVKDISGMFSSTGLVSFTFPQCQNPELLTMTQMFDGCHKLQKVNFGGFDTSKVTNMRLIFNECYSLKSIDLSVLDTSNLEILESMCFNCFSLEKFIASNINTSSLTNINSIFYNCISLKSVDFSNFGKLYVNDTGYAFNNCSSLKYIDLTNLETPSVNQQNIMSYLFYYCSSLIALEIPNFFMEYLVKSEDVFTNVNKLRYINLENVKYNENNEETCDSNGNNLPLNYSGKPIIVCQKYNCITHTNIYEICCRFNVETEMCESDNYIVLYFNKDCNYENGFKKDYRNGINFVNYNNETITDSVALNISAGTKLEIHFKSNNTDMENFFSQEADENMIGIVSIDLSNFNSSSVINMASMFKGCLSLTSIDLSHFDSSSVINMASMFKGCLSLTSIDLSNFDTSSVVNMNYMFFQCSLLKEINLSYTSTPSLTSIDYMFYNCTSLEILDISNFNFLQVTNNTNMFAGIKNLRYINLYNIQDREIISFSEINNNMEKEFYVCQKTNIITSNKAVNCCNYYDNEPHCDNEIITTQANYPIQTTINIPKETTYNTHSKTSFNTHIETTFNTHIENSFNSLIETAINTKFESKTDIIINTIGTTIINVTEQIEKLYENIIGNMPNEDYKIIRLQATTFQFSTVEEQLNNKSNGVSSVDLGECEQKLREQEGLRESEQFLMVKLDIRNSTNNGTYVQYEIFNPRNYSKVSLEVCKNISIKIQVPVALEESTLSFISSLEENGYNVFDLNDEFYNDICSTYTAPNGADMALSSRKNIIYDSVKDIYFCQEGCELESFDTDSSKAHCSCQVQETETVTDVSKISFGKKELINSFYSTLYNSNFRVLNCVKLLFSLKGMKGNYGCYTMTFLLGSFISFIVVHLIKGQTKIVDVLRGILKSKGIIKNKNNHNHQKIENENKETIEVGERKINRKKIKRSHTTKNNNLIRFQDQKMENLNAPFKRKKKKKNKTLKNKRILSTNDLTFETKDDINKITLENNENINKKGINKIEDGKKIFEKYKNLNDVEKNALDYEMAIVADKRTFCQYYVSLLKREHLIIFTFITVDDYNLRQIKILLFIVSFSLYFTINAFFFYDETMDKIYEDKGMFNFIFQLPQILYSSIISSVINIILKKLSITEEQILDMKKEKDIEKLKQKARKIKRGLKIKLIIFLTLSSLLMLFFWYFISCFCAAYKNTQLILIEDTLISFFTSMLYPLGLKLLPGMFRIPALRAPKKDQKYLYKISRILNIL